MRCHAGPGTGSGAPEVKGVILKSLTGHLRTVLRHRHLVFVHCLRAGIPLQGLTHDLSKCSPREFIPGVRYFSGEHSPNDDERRDKGYSEAWMHHKGRNRHHWEYWTDFSASEGRYVPVEMPRRFLAEMICDRMAASKVYRGREYTDSSAYEYLTRGRMRDQMNPRTRETLEYFLLLLSREGEERMFDRLRRYIKGEEI